MNRDDELSQQVIEVWEQKRNPNRLETISWEAVLAIGFFVAFAPAIIWGLLITWLAWQVTDHWTAVAAGFAAFLVSLYSGAWLALILQLMPADWIKGVR